MCVDLHCTVLVTDIGVKPAPSFLNRCLDLTFHTTRVSSFHFDKELLDCVERSFSLSKFFVTGIFAQLCFLTFVITVSYSCVSALPLSHYSVFLSFPVNFCISRKN